MTAKYKLYNGAPDHAERSGRLAWIFERKDAGTLPGDERHIIKVWRGKQSAPYANYWFPTAEKRQQWLDHEIAKDAANVAAKKARQAQQRAENDAVAGTVKPGDVFVESWGYDQTNVDAYVVIRVSDSGKTVYLKPCGLKAEGEGFSTRMRPNPDQVLEYTFGSSRIGKVLKDGTVRKALQAFGDTTFVNLTTYSSGFLWDGTRTYYDTLAAGQPGH